MENPNMAVWAELEHLKISVRSVTDEHHMRLLTIAGKKLNWLDFKGFSVEVITKESGGAESVVQEAKNTDVLLISCPPEELPEDIRTGLSICEERPHIICIDDDLQCTLSTVKLQIASTCRDYLKFGGDDNFTNMFLFIAREVMKLPVVCDLPRSVSWESCYSHQEFSAVSRNDISMEIRHK